MYNATTPKRQIEYRDLRCAPLLEGVLVMNDKGMDIVGLLKQRKATLLNELKRIDIALDALTGELGPKKSTQSRIAWAEEVRKVLRSGELLSVQDIRSRLAQQGITKALDNNYASSVYATLSRMVSKGKITKDEEGRYSLKKAGLFSKETS